MIAYFLGLYWPRIQRNFEMAIKVIASLTPYQETISSFSLAPSPYPPTPTPNIAIVQFSPTSKATSTR